MGLFDLLFGKKDTNKSKNVCLNRKNINIKTYPAVVKVDCFDSVIKNAKPNINVGDTGYFIYDSLPQLSSTKHTSVAVCINNVNCGYLPYFVGDCLNNVKLDYSFIVDSVDFNIGTLYIKINLPFNYKLPPISATAVANNQSIIQNCNIGDCLTLRYNDNTFNIYNDNIDNNIGIVDNLFVDKISKRFNKNKPLRAVITKLHKGTNKDYIYIYVLTDDVEV